MTHLGAFKTQLVVTIVPYIYINTHPYLTNLICTLQDSVPDGSYNDPFQSSVCVNVCVSQKQPRASLLHNARQIAIHDSSWMAKLSTSTFTLSLSFSLMLENSMPSVSMRNFQSGIIGAWVS